MRKVVLAFGVLAAALSGGGAKADPNLVLNPGFEADYCPGGPPCSPSQFASPPTDWGASNADSGADNSDPRTGNMDGFVGLGQLAQTLTGLVPTATYDVQFFVAESLSLFLADSDSDVLTVSLGSDVVDTILGSDISFPSDNAYVFEGVFAATATSPSELLSFVSNSVDGPWYIDDVSVTCASAACAAATAVPEPTSLGLLVAALLGFGGNEARRRRRRAA